MADEDMTAQFKALTELVQQLQVENARLRSEASQSSSSVPIGVLPSGEQQPPSAGASAMGSSPILNPVGTVEHYVYVPRERKIDFLGSYPKTL